MIHEFKPINSPYFGENGLTSTSANTIANRLKHLYESTENDLNSTGFVQARFGLIGTPEDKFSLAKDAKKSCTAIELVTKLELIAECKSFIAFLREAIKAKQELANEVDEYISEEYAALKRPVLESTITTEEVINNMSIKDREHYLSLEARAAVYGKFIHPGNPFDKAIKELEKALTNPRQIDYNGANTIIKVYTPTVDIETVNTVYMDLQNEHRKSESELNGIKHSIEEQIKADDTKKREAYKVALDKFETDRAQLVIRDAETKQARRKEIEKLKIVIPKRFEALYNKIK